jgi:hypothetical protein
VSFIFDEGHRNEDGLKEYYAQIKSDHPNMPLGTIGFDSDDRILPIKVGDFLAFEMTQHIERLHGDNSRPMRKSFASLLDGMIQTETRFLDEGYFWQLIDACKKMEAVQSQRPYVLIAVEMDFSQMKIKSTYAPLARGQRIIARGHVPPVAEPESEPPQ